GTKAHPLSTIAIATALIVFIIFLYLSGFNGPVGTVNRYCKPLGDFDGRLQAHKDIVQKLHLEFVNGIRSGNGDFHIRVPSDSPRRPATTSLLLTDVGLLRISIHHPIGNVMDELVHNFPWF
ncbi:MAG TPA: hypothetical protein VIE65_04610, partial [Methylobacter sp.]